MSIRNFFHNKIIIRTLTAVVLISVSFTLTAVFPTPFTPNDKTAVFAQSDAPTPTLAAYPAENNGNGNLTETAVPVLPVDTETEEGETVFNTQDYPANNDTTTADGTPPPYPPSFESENNSSNVIGSNSANGNGSNVNSEIKSNNIILWGGFIVTLLIFFIGLIGSAILFTRKK